jgi:4-diphosphocytidyl-2-C-methyl-D-erythritol kinase
MTKKNNRSSIVIAAPAKVNTYLKIGIRRPDGYHDLETVFQEISLHDTLHARLTDGPLSLTVCPASLLSSGPDNLVIKALTLLRSKLKIKRGLQVTLTKRIPMGAGLGGGSSDAAAALKAGWLLWTGKKLNPLSPILFECAKKLGADVSFFLQGGTAWASGIGEKLTRLPALPKRWMVLVYPRAHVSTPLAYKLLDKARKKTSLDFALRNSFEPVVFAKFPMVRAAHQALIKAGCSDVLMSGSGASVFGLVKNKTHGQSIKRRLSSKPWDIYLVSTRPES